MKYIFCLILAGLCLGCSKSISEIAHEQDSEIMQLVEDNNWDAIRTNDGLYIVIEKEGNQVFPTSTSDVLVDYTGTLLDGTQFDAGEGIFNLQSVIKGWTVGVPYFSEGGMGKLIVPSHLGYGNQDHGPIPKNSILLFDIHLKEVK